MEFHEIIYKLALSILLVPSTFGAEQENIPYSCSKMCSEISCKCFISRMKLIFNFVAKATELKMAEVIRNQ